MIRILSIFTLVLFLIGVQDADAQRWKLKRYRLYFGAGSANYFGDIGGAATPSNMMGLKDIQFQYTRPVIHVGALYKVMQALDVKYSINYGTMTGSDVGSKNDKRNLSFASSFFETSLQINYSFLRIGGSKGGGIFSRRGMLNDYSALNIYGFVGAGLLYFNPNTTALNPKTLSKIGEFTNTTLVAPAGLGVYYVLSSSLEIGLEVGGRFTLSDYLDGYTSKFSKSYDIYYLTMLNAIYRIKTDRRGRPIFKFSR